MRAHFPRRRLIPGKKQTDEEDEEKKQKCRERECVATFKYQAKLAAEMARLTVMDKTRLIVDNATQEIAEETNKIQDGEEQVL
jgi:anaerobic ribonucleoside-triphosphate reductase